MAINQAVLFSKPLYHLDISLTYEELNFEIQKFLQDHDIYIRSYKKIDGKNLESRKILNKHYGIYDYASSIDSIKDLIISNKAKTIFEKAIKNLRYCIVFLQKFFFLRQRSIFQTLLKATRHKHGVVRWSYCLHILVCYSMFLQRNILPQSRSNAIKHRIYLCCQTNFSRDLR